MFPERKKIIYVYIHIYIYIIKNESRNSTESKSIMAEKMDTEPAAGGGGEASAGGGPAAAAPAPVSGLRFEIKKWNAVTMWSWDICADTCAICRNSLNEPSIEYQANPSPANENGLTIAFGNCGHVFHLDCIQRWQKTRSVCPLCNREWDYTKIEKIPGYGNLMG